MYFFISPKWVPFNDPCSNTNISPKRSTFPSPQVDVSLQAVFFKNQSVGWNQAAKATMAVKTDPRSNDYCYEYVLYKCKLENHRAIYTTHMIVENMGTHNKLQGPPPKKVPYSSRIVSLTLVGPDDTQNPRIRLSMNAPIVTVCNLHPVWTNRSMTIRLFEQTDNKCGCFFEGWQTKNIPMGCHAVLCIIQFVVAFLGKFHVLTLATRECALLCCFVHVFTLFGIRTFYNYKDDLFNPCHLSSFIIISHVLSLARANGFKKPERAVAAAGNQNDIVFAEKTTPSYWHNSHWITFTMVHCLVMLKIISIQYNNIMLFLSG